MDGHEGRRRQPDVGCHGHRQPDATVRAPAQSEVPRQRTTVHRDAQALGQGCDHRVREVLLQDPRHAPALNAQVDRQHGVSHGAINAARSASSRVTRARPPPLPARTSAQAAPRRLRTYAAISASNASRLPALAWAIASRSSSMVSLVSLIEPRSTWVSRQSPAAFPQDQFVGPSQAIWAKPSFRPHSGSIPAGFSSARAQRTALELPVACRAATRACPGDVRGARYAAATNHRRGSP